MAPKYKLFYYDAITAVAEPVRFLFSYGGIEFEDVRIPDENWPTVKKTMPFGQVPVLEIDGKKINQSLAISRYVAKLVKLAGKDNLHALEIDAMVDNIDDLHQKIATYCYEADKDKKEKKRATFINEILPYILGKLDLIAKDNNGYFIRGELSWVDVLFAALLDSFNYMLKFDMLEKYSNLQKVHDNVLAVPAIMAWVAKRPKTYM